MATWIDEELATLDLGDDLLNRRQKRVRRRCADRPHASIPGACRGWAETQGVSRFFSHPRVTAEAVLQPHCDATTRRIAEHPVVLLPQDTTERDFTRLQKRVQGAGPRNWEPRIGFLPHVPLAVTPERLPWGVVAVTTWGRDPEDHRTTDRRKPRPIEQKESDRGMEGDRRACAVAQQVPSTPIIAIADRAGDISACFVEAAEASGPRADGIIRVCQDRRLPERSQETPEFDTLGETVAAPVPLGRRRVRLPRSGRGPAREATLTMHAARVDLRPPQRVGRNLPVASVNAVLVRAESPPRGVEPIEWLLLTDLAVETFKDACRVVSDSSCRWQVEVFVRVSQSGCRVEEIGLETKTRLKPCLSLSRSVAWRVLWLTMRGGMSPELPCDPVLAEAEGRSVWRSCMSRPLPRWHRR